MSHDKFLIKGAGLQKTFKDFWGRPKVKAIQNIDITVPKGSIFGLLGPNGAGKSTLLKIILGHLYPTAGRIQVLGKDPRDVSIKQKMGYLPERSYLYKNLTATETLHYFGEILGLDKKQIKSRTEQLLEMVGLKNAIHRQVGQFSHGMTRRMGLAQALLNDPELLILDEPTAGLDPLGCREVKDLIITLGQRGKTVLLTSHLLADVEDVADDLLVIYGGTVQSGGKANQLLQDQDKTRLEFPNVSQATMQKALASLKLELPSSSINITSPNQSLEDYFINIVQKSTAKGSSNSGAAAGSGVADYLKDEKNLEDTRVREQESGNKKEIEPQISQINTDEKTILNDVNQEQNLIKDSEPQKTHKSTENHSELNIQNSKLESPGNAEFQSASTSDINKKEVEPRNTQKNTDEKTILNEKQKETGQQSVDKSSGNADGSYASNSKLESPGNAEFQSASTSDIKKKDPEPRNTQKNTDEKTILNEKQKETGQQSVDKSSGNADGSSATNSKLESPGNAEFQSASTSDINKKDPEPRNTLKSTEVRTRNQEAGSEQDLSEAQPKPSAAQAKRSPSKAPAEPQAALPPVPKLGLSENEAKSIKVGKINKVIHRS
ncbi:putative ABC transporter ATP-binding protein [Lentisphaera araneosa HTCC2155]|uniref:Putative ABC transporter ATP-binding protein n=1 Tax=Lentisphaera araneosa HTCC2155 TaxID=313628 RepID=A6DTT4_9BACT|nr:ATP-binding cassette domain-containing protein [Lentisphaera araneosa]EDM24955.1 putative ABC transporter ATP-binding protein [Lentisphaera araneosa HTCC2155]